MTEDRPNGPHIEIRPLTEEEAERMDRVLEEARALRQAILKRRKGKPVPSSWKLIRQAREERSKRL